MSEKMIPISCEERIRFLEKEIDRCDVINDELDYKNILLKKMIYYLRRAVKQLVIANGGYGDMRNAIENSEMVIDMTEGVDEA